MKTITSILIALLTPLFFSGCLTTGTSGPSAAQINQTISTVAGLVQFAGGVYQQYSAVKSGQINAAQVPTLASNDLYSLATALQAIQGTTATPASANVLQSAANPVPAASVIASLPAGPVSQTTVNQVFAAAAALAAKQPTGASIKTYRKNLVTPEGVIVRSEAQSLEYRPTVLIHLSDR